MQTLTEQRLAEAVRQREIWASRLASADRERALLEAADAHARQERSAVALQAVVDGAAAGDRLKDLNSADRERWAIVEALAAARPKIEAEIADADCRISMLRELQTAEMLAAEVDELRAVASQCDTAARKFADALEASLKAGLFPHHGGAPGNKDGLAQLLIASGVAPLLGNFGIEIPEPRPETQYAGGTVLHVQPVRTLAEQFEVTIAAPRAEALAQLQRAAELAKDIQAATSPTALPVGVTS